MSHEDMKEYCGPDRRKHVEVECSQEERLLKIECESQKLIESAKANASLLTETLAIVKDLDHKLFHSNGTEALIPEIRSRLKSLEGSIMPRDDVRDVVEAFKVGKTIIRAVGLVAAIGAAGILFWHLFQLSTPPRGTP